MPDRIESTFGNINYFAGYLIQLIPLFMAYFLTPATKGIKSSQRVLYFVIIALLYLSLLFTGTRAALFAALFSTCLFVLGWMLIKNNVSSKHLRNSTIIIFIIIGITFYLHQNRIVDLFGYNAWHSRIIPWQAAFDSIKNAPIFGYGLGASYELFFEFNDPQGRLALPNYSYNHVHFELLEIAQEGGILGVFGYLVFWGYVLISLAKLCLNNKVSDFDRILALSLICSFIAFHIHSCFSVAPRMIAVKLVTYTLIAYSLILIDRYRVYPHKDKTSKVPILLILVALLSILAWLVPFLSSQYHYAKTLPSQLIKPLKSISHSSNDIYTINRSAWRAKDIKDQDWLEEMLIKSHDVFPNYRKLAYLNAHNALLVDNHNKARELALAEQEKDLYLNELNELLAYIALKTSDRDLFVDQLSIALKLIFCRELKVYCDQKPIKVLWGETLFAINAIENKNGTTFIIANDLFTKIQQNNIDLISQVFRKSPYFRPQVKNGGHINRHDWQQLHQYVELSDAINKQTTFLTKELAQNSGATLYQQIRQYHEIKSKHVQFLTTSQLSIQEIEALLNHKIDLETFLKNRVIYSHIINWLRTVKTYNN